MQRRGPCRASARYESFRKLWLADHARNGFGECLQPTLPVGQPASCAMNFFRAFATLGAMTI